MMRTEAMERRSNRPLVPNEGRVPISLQKKLAETKRLNQNNSHDQIPDITDFMNDMFFGTISSPEHKKTYNLSGGEGRVDRDEESFDSSTRSVSSRQTQEWLEEARRMVASSPTREGESARRTSSPRFGMSQGRLSTSSLEKRDPLSRSARRHRTLDGSSGEILSKAAMHTRNRSESNLNPPLVEASSPTSEIQKWIANNINPDPTASPEPTPPSPTSPMGPPPLPPRQSIHRRSRFQSDPNAPLSHPIPTPTPTNLPAISIPKRNFKNINTNTYSNNNNGAQTTTILDTQLLSPPKHLVESAHRRSISSTTCSVPEAKIRSSPPNFLEAAHRTSVSSSTSKNEMIIEKSNLDDWQRDLKGEDLNVFLKEQRIKIEKLLNGEINGKAKIVLSGPSNTTSSMVAAICYAWLLENRMRANNKKGGNANVVEFVVPVMNIRRAKMWKQRQASWLFHHVGLDATSLLFSNEVELETLMMAMQLSMLVVGEDILKTNGDVGSACTILTDNYCEDAYDLLQTPILKKLLVAGILLDTQNLSPSPKLSMSRDAEAVQLLLVSSPPNYRNTLFDHLMQDHRDEDFFEILRLAYGKSPNEMKGRTQTGRGVSEKNPWNEANAVNEDRKQNDTNDVKAKKISPTPGKPTPSPGQAPAPPGKSSDATRGKNKNFFARLFGFGSK